MSIETHRNYTIIEKRIQHKSEMPVGTLYSHYKDPIPKYKVLHHNRANSLRCLQLKSGGEYATNFPCNVYIYTLASIDEVLDKLFEDD